MSSIDRFNRFKRAPAVALVLLMFASAGHAATFPPPVGHVNDFAKMLTALTSAQLEQRMQSIEQQTGVQIAVATVESLHGDSVEHVAQELFKQWGIGKKGKDNGVLLLIAKNDHKSRIEVGYGLEGTLTDVGTSRMQREILVPAFQQGQFDSGVAQTVDAIERAIQGDASINTPAPPLPAQRSFSFINPIAIFYFVLILFSWLASVLGRSKSWWAGGIGGGVLGFVLGIIFFSVSFALAGAAMFGILGALFDFFVSRHYQDRRAQGIRPRWWAGGGWGGGGWGGSGGGGFGGFGGGSSGGGGSSASW